jgi:hypothetical protein
MTTTTRTNFFVATLLLTVAILATWVVTDRRSYTSLTTIEIVESIPDADDPLANTGFYDDGPVETAVERPGFHLGLLPAPRGILDFHALSVLTLLGLAWAPHLLLLARRILRKRSAITPLPENTHAFSPKTR